MTTIDRAAIERELRQFAADVVRTNKVTSDGHDAAAVVLREAVDRIASIREPKREGEPPLDQKVEWLRWYRREFNASLKQGMDEWASRAVPEAKEDALAYATRLAVLIREKHFPDVPQFRPLPDLYGVLTQIDNMAAGMVRAAPQPAPEAGKLPSVEAANRLREIIDSLPKSDPGPARDPKWHDWISHGNYDDVAADAVAEEKWKLKRELEAVLALLSPAPPHDVPAGEDVLAIGTPVEKFTGEARWEGVIRAIYRTGKGSLRYVVEVEPQGFQMIAVPSQLRPRSTSGRA